MVGGRIFIMKKILGIWFCGLSGAGKSYASIFLEKKIKNSIKIEGDTVRKFFIYDPTLGYTKKDRIKSAKRNLQIANFLIYEKKFPLVSNAYLNQNVVELAKKENIKVIQIIRKEKVNVKFDNDEKNVLGRDIKFENLKCSKIINDDNFEKKLLKLINKYLL